MRPSVTSAPSGPGDERHATDKGADAVGTDDLSRYRASTAEIEREQDLFRLMPAKGEVALDVGARDGHFSRRLAERFAQVVALDLTLPAIEHPRVRCIVGNAERLLFPDRAFDFVLCAEVLEHVPPAALPVVCRELTRVAGGQLLIGVPYRQDLRVGRSTCASCGGRNPPWGHVNVFDEQRVASLFSECRVVAVSFVGSTTVSTNAAAALLMDLAGNPFGTYIQDEPCVHCGAPLRAPPPRNTMKKVLTRLAFIAMSATGRLRKPRAKWMHVLLEAPR